MALSWIVVSNPTGQKSQKSALEIFLLQSIITWIFSRSIFLSQKPSKAPALIKLSSDFLLTILEHLLRKSSSDENFPFWTLSCWIVSQISDPTPFTEKNQSLTSSSIAAT
jgi:hypothetical protein